MDHGFGALPLDSRIGVAMHELPSVVLSATYAGHPYRDVAGLGLATDLYPGPLDLNRVGHVGTDGLGHGLEGDRLAVAEV